MPERTEYRLLYRAEWTDGWEVSTYKLNRNLKKLQKAEPGLNEVGYETRIETRHVTETEWKTVDEEKA